MNILTQNNNIILRDYLPSDIEAYLKWMTTGEWLKFDAPWESIDISEKGLMEKRARFLEICKQELAVPRKRAIIEVDREKPIGWVNRYTHKNSPYAWLIGIDICEDEFLGKGLGTQILKLWVDYLFENSDFHRLGLETWSFNRPMIKVAEKAGFILEGTQRQVRNWQDQWLDLHNYGMLREDWEKRVQS